MPRFPGLHWHCWVAASCDTRSGEGAGTWVPPGWVEVQAPRLFSLTLHRWGEGGGGRHSPEGMRRETPPPHVVAGWEAGVWLNRAVWSVRFLSCWEVLSWSLGQRDSFRWVFWSAHWCFQVAGFFSSKPGIMMQKEDVRDSPPHRPRVPCCSAVSPLPSRASSCLLCLCRPGFSVGLNGGRALRRPTTRAPVPALSPALSQ